MLKDISMYNCCQAKPMYLFLVFPHTKLALVLKITQYLLPLILLKLCTTFFAKHAKMPLLFHYSWTVLKASSPKILMQCIKFCRMLSRTCFQVHQRTIQESKNFTLKLGNFVFKMFPIRVAAFLAHKLSQISKWPITSLDQSSQLHFRHIPWITCSFL